MPALIASNSKIACHAAKVALNKRKNRSLYFGCGLATGISALFELAEHEDFQLDKVTCFEVTSQSEGDALCLMALPIGHASGVSGNAEMSATSITATAEAMDMICDENPDMLAIEVVNSS